MCALLGFAWSGVSAKINPNLTLKLKHKVGASEEFRSTNWEP